MKNFYTIISQTYTEQVIEALVAINSSHQIFESHFPEQPVVPGVCMLYMQKEILESNLQKKLLLTQSSTIKFLTLFAPPHHTQATFIIKITLVNDNYFIQSILQHGETIFMKMQGTYTLR